MVVEAEQVQLSFSSLIQLAAIHLCCHEILAAAVSGLQVLFLQTEKAVSAWALLPLLHLIDQYCTAISSDGSCCSKAKKI